MVDREFAEKLIALVNRCINPLSDIFRADKTVKMRVVVNYDPQLDKIEITYFEEEVG